MIKRRFVMIKGGLLGHPAEEQEGGSDQVYIIDSSISVQPHHHHHHQSQKERHQEAETAITRGVLP